MLQYFEKYPSPFNKDYFDNIKHPVPTKKRKVTTDSQKFEINDLQLVECCYNFLKTNAEFFRTRWDWSDFMRKYLNQKDDMITWLYWQCVAIITGMNEKQLNSLLEKCLSKEKLIECCVKHYDESKFSQNLNLHITKPVDEITENLTSDVVDINAQHLSDNIISVAGIQLPVYQRNSNVKHLVQVKSAQSNLRKVALGISANRAICLQGPVGSSKTAIVEYLAALTGRTLGETFIKVQLGDQTDSKMLLGTYRCTDIPGEFIWQPGVLTQVKIIVFIILNGLLIIYIVLRLLLKEVGCCWKI